MCERESFAAIISMNNIGFVCILARHSYVFCPLTIIDSRKVSVSKIMVNKTLFHRVQKGFLSDKSSFFSFSYFTMGFKTTDFSTKNILQIENK